MLARQCLVDRLEQVDDEAVEQSGAVTSAKLSRQPAVNCSAKLNLRVVKPELEVGSV